MLFHVREKKDKEIGLKKNVLGGFFGKDFPVYLYQQENCAICEGFVVSQKHPKGENVRSWEERTKEQKNEKTRLF